MLGIIKYLKFLNLIKDLLIMEQNIKLDIKSSYNNNQNSTNDNIQSNNLNVNNYK